MCLEEDKCSKCDEDRNINGFVKRRKICKKCANANSKKYKEKNKEKISEYNKKYKYAHREEICEYNKKYNIKNRKEIQTRHTAYLREKRQTDPQYKISSLLRTRINKVINGQNKENTLKMLGCSYKFLMNWLSFQFEDDMTFDNHGLVWHIDHIIPCNCFDLTDNDERLKCFNWSNLQPLYAQKNLSKKDKTDKYEIIFKSDLAVKFIKLTKPEETPILINYDKLKYLN